MVAKYADGWNYGLCTYDEYLSKISILRDCCKAVGRDCEIIAKAWHAIMLLGHNDSEIKMLKIQKIVIILQVTVVVSGKRIWLSLEHLMIS